MEKACEPIGWTTIRSNQTPFDRLTRVLGFELANEKIMSSRTARRGSAKKENEAFFKILLRAVFKKPMPSHPQPAARSAQRASAGKLQKQRHKTKERPTDLESA